MSKTLKKLQKFEGVTGPVVTIVMDGVGLAPETAGNAVFAAYTPTLDRLMREYPTVRLKAHGTAVGLPSDDDMGNSEVGHNALGAGQVFAQGAKLVSNSIESGKMFASPTWQKLVGNVKQTGGVLHFLGLFSDGNVHSHIDHLKAMVKEAKAEGVKTVASTPSLTGVTWARPPRLNISSRLRHSSPSLTATGLMPLSPAAAAV